MICTSEVNTIIIILILGIIIYLVFNNKNTSNIEFGKKIHLLDQMIKESKKNIQKKINIKEDLHQEYASTDIIDVDKQSNKQGNKQNSSSKRLGDSFVVDLPLQTSILPLNDPVIERDRAVLDDQLYPPLGRTERPIFDQLVTGISSGYFSYPTRGSPDTFRLIAYLVNNSDKKDTWKLFGRQKYPGSSQGEYYAIQMDDRKSDMKITIKDEMMPKDKIRDIYGLPNEVTIISPLFNSNPYKVIELDKSDLTSPYL